MNCQSSRERLPLLVYGDLSADEAREAAAHLADCPGCRCERDALLATKRALDAAATTEVSVDVAAIHAQVLSTQVRTLRRWRRFAITAGTLAASLLAILLIRPDVRIGEGQMIVRWRADPVRPRIEDSMTTTALPHSLRDAELEERVRVLNDLVQVLHFQMEHADQQRREELEVLITRLDLLRIQSQQRWDETKRDVTTLYTAQFGRRD